MDETSSGAYTIGMRIPAFSIAALSVAMACTKQAPEPAAEAPAMAPDLTLMQRLEVEARSRPSQTARAEEVLAALEASGIRLVGRKQMYARTIGASYCFGARTERGMGVAVCEFSDEGAAQRGRNYSIETFRKLIPHRELLLNRKTLMTLVRPDKTPAIDAEAKAAATVFARL